MQMPRRQGRAGQACQGAGRAGGFTLIEMAVTLVIIAVIFALAIPSFRTVVISNRLSTAANDVTDAINTARVEAVKRNGNVQFCSNSSSSNNSDALGNACGTNAGAVVGAGVDSTGKAVVDQVRGTLAGVTSPLKISGDATALRFNGQGMGMKVGGAAAPYSGQVIDICTSNLGKDNHRTVSLVAGSIVQIDVSTGDCT